MIVPLGAERLMASESYIRLVWPGTFLWAGIMLIQIPILFMFIEALTICSKFGIVSRLDAELIDQDLELGT